MVNLNTEPTDPDARDLMKNSSENTPQDAVKVIDRAKHYDMAPDTYDSMKDVLDPEAELEEEIPAQVTPAVKEYASKSANHAKSIKKELSTFDTIANHANAMWYQLYGKRETDSKIEKLQAEQFDSGKLPSHKKEILDYMLDERSTKEQSFGLDGFEQAPSMIAGVVGDVGEAVIKSPALITASTLAGAGIGATALGAGIIPGAGTGFGLGITGAIALDAYRRITHSSYDELGRMTDDKGQPLNLSVDTKSNIAVGLGLTTALFEAATGKALVGVSKLAGKAVAKKTAMEIVKNTSTRTALDALGHIVKVGAIGGTEEVAGDVADLISKEYAKGHNSEEGLINAIRKVTHKIKTDTATQKQLGLTFVVGAGAGGTMATATVIPALPKIKRAYDKNNEQILTYEKEVKKQRVQNKIFQDAMNAINNQENVENMSKMSVETELKNLSPEQMSDFRKTAFEQAGFKDKVWFSEADIVTIEENNPELGAKLREMDNTESSNSDTSSMIGINQHQFLDLVDEVPTVSEYARLHPEAPNPLESKNLLERFKDIQTKRQAFLETLDTEAELTPEQVQTLNDFDAVVEEGFNNAGQQAYLEDAVTFSENIEGVTPDKKVESFNKAQRRAREDVAEQMVKEFEVRETRAENKVVKLNEDIFKKQQLERLSESNKIVDKFKIDKKEIGKNSHKRAGRSKFAIDPKFLPENLREDYVNDPKLKKRNVFVEGGLNPDEAAGLLGVENGVELLSILANTPTNQEMIAERKAASENVRKQVKESRDKSVDKRRDKIFNDLIKIHKKEMDYMRSKEWAATKQGVKQIFLPTPNLAELNETARKVVNKTRVGDLKPRQFNAAEKALQKQAGNQILKNEVEKAYITKEKAILNAELTRESLKARDKIVKAKAIIKRISSKKGIDLFKNANMLKQVNEIFELFDLLGSDPKGRKQDSYFKYLESLDKKGGTVIVEPQNADLRQTGTELSVEEFLRVTDRLTTLEKQAKLKNKLFKNNAEMEKLNQVQTEEAIVVDAVLDLEQHPTFSKAKLEQVQNKNSKTFMQVMQEAYGFVASTQTNFKNIVTELDQERLGGKHYNNIAQPMINGESFKRDKTHQTVNHIKKIVKNYGEVDYRKAFNEVIDIPEFEGFTGLGLGRMVRSDLWTLQAYLGDPKARQRIENFIHTDETTQMDIDTVQRVLDRVLTEKDAKLSQDFVNIFKSFEQEAFDLHVRTTGVEPTMVKGVTFTHQGKVYEGGYTPLNYLNTSPTELANRFLEVVGDKEISQFGAGKEEGKLYSLLRSSEMTDQGRLQERGSTTRSLDTSFGNFMGAYEEHIHDLAYRENGSDVLKLLRNPVYSNAIIATVGTAKYKTMVSAIIETVGKNKGEDLLNPYGTVAKKIMKAYNYMEQGFNIGTLGFSPSSVAMQPLSLGAATLRVGEGGKKYLAKSLGQSAQALLEGNYQETFDRAVEINPDLKYNQDSVDDTMVKSTYGDLLPSKSLLGAKGAMLKRGQAKLIDASMLGLKMADIHLKVAVTNGAYAQFIDGKVENFPQSKLNNMTEAEIDLAAKKYAKQVADLALTTSADIDKNALEKVAFMRIFSRFYTDLRSQQNTTFSEARKIRNESIKAVKEGDASKRMGHIKKGGMSLGMLFGVHTMAQMYIGMLQDEKTPLSELVKVRDLDDFGKYMAGTAKYVMQAPLKGVADSTLGLRDLKWTLGWRGPNKRVAFPMNKMFSDVAMSITGLADLLEGDSLSGNQKKALMFTSSYITGGLPVNGPAKILRIFSKTGVTGAVAGFIRNETNRLSENIDKWIADNPKETEMIEHLEEIKADVVPALEQNMNTIVPEDSLEVLKMNKWNHQDPDTGAAGEYGFTEEAWETLTDNNPDLNLTEDGRTSMNTSEQERAMNRTNTDNARVLTAYGIDVNNSTLYGAHRFGAEDFVNVMLSDNNDEKLSKLVVNKELFKGFKTVKQVKKYVNKQVKKNTIDNK